MTQKNRSILAILFIIVVLAAYRIAVGHIQLPHETPDSWSYFDLRNLFLGKENVYNGIRSPGYPFFLLLTGTSVHTIYLLQSCLGIITAVLLYLLGRRLNLSHTAAIACALFPGLDRGLVGHEFRVMTESLCGFLLVASACCLERSVHRKSLIWPLLSSFLLAWLMLTRPQFLFIIPFLAFLWLPEKFSTANLLARVRPCAVLYIPLLIAITFWGSFNYHRIGSFTLSTLDGAGLSNHMGPIMEKAPDRYAVIRDMYINHREIMIERQGDHQNTLLEIQNDLSQALGLPWAECNREIKALCYELIRQNPNVYFKSVWQSWLRAPLWVYNYQIKRDSSSINLPPAVFFILNRLEELLTRVISPFFNVSLWLALICWIHQASIRSSLSNPTFRLIGLLLIVALGNMTIPHIIGGTMESWRLYSPAQWLAPLIFFTVIGTRLFPSLATTTPKHADPTQNA